MQLLELNINKILLLENYKFQNPYNNIDYLNNLAIVQNDHDQKMSLLKLATSKIEKFHSYFHFEQSFFNLQLAIELLKTEDKELAREQLEMAIFQDHCNDQAIELLHKGYSAKQYNRIFSKCQDYLAFATEEKLPDDDYSNGRPEGYWAIFEKYKLKPNKEYLQEIIAQIRQNHLSYHQEAAKLYLNRAAVFHDLQQEDLAKNDLRKALYLDSKLKERDYYTNF